MEQSSESLIFVLVFGLLLFAGSIGLVASCLRNSDRDDDCVFGVEADITEVGGSDVGGSDEGATTKNDDESDIELVILSERPTEIVSSTTP
mmetsp:Transcript_1867/g.4009  ORF Transcript_1867/g.4009 Transcript_1867/m.4009 type:complete len:91 (-) Transcript_1867:466-738(-)|eukprot:CAMPEP_0201120890 /NCGR_PEP_ID=MMETSP0850-20130426/4874_1 /ASSEMBLY_ACC=CAM_ASM_000622 /TAXON_ID=183588 /ORGANISM="Pseudo-nitzschia fraudulenta, Strain WWA7" /LENGTH=90 /DNA_ID=CAMNT_0047387171 /DNA_START=83 /DNA_END=355 /DNA_ORIENTATION=+